MNPPDDRRWWPCYSADASEVDVRRWAAKKLGVPEEQVEVKRIGGGGWLARERREGQDD